jgi:hypothetical protein
MPVEYESVVEMGIDNLAELPAEWVNEFFWKCCTRIGL